MVRNHDQELSCSKSLRVVLWTFSSLMKLTHEEMWYSSSHNHGKWKMGLPGQFPVKHPQQINISTTLKADHFKKAAIIHLVNDLIHVLRGRLLLVKKRKVGHLLVRNTAKSTSTGVFSSLQVE